MVFKEHAFPLQALTRVFLAFLGVFRVYMVQVYSAALEHPAMDLLAPRLRHDEEVDVPLFEIAVQLVEPTRRHVRD